MGTNGYKWNAQEEDYSVSEVLRKLHHLALMATDMAFSIHTNAVEGFDALCLEAENMDEILNYLHAALLMTPQHGVVDYQQWVKKPDHGSEKACNS
ncbi:hypothetical protein JKG47_08700 [Acidithiobacillus sp. MC6.1]|nr:hypothetical protein [Acidithiobacillus sp. MC6.1]